LTTKQDVTLALSVSGGGDYDAMVFAVVTIIPPYAETLLRLMAHVTEAKRLHRSAYRLDAFDSTAQFYDHESLGDQELEVVIGKRAAKGVERQANPRLFEGVLSKTFATIEPARTECETVVVGEDEVFWSALRKHGDDAFETNYVTRKELAAIAGGK
jgi:hypothetical protein